MSGASEAPLPNFEGREVAVGNTFRNRTAVWWANLALRMASRQYRSFIKGVIVLGVATAIREAQDGPGAPARGEVDSPGCTGDGSGAESGSSDPAVRLTLATNHIRKANADRVVWFDGQEYMNVDDAAHLLADHLRAGDDAESALDALERGEARVGRVVDLTGDDGEGC